MNTTINDSRREAIKALAHLLTALKIHTPKMSELLVEMNKFAMSEMRITPSAYKKIFALQSYTLEAKQILENLSPDIKLNEHLKALLEEGTGNDCETMIHSRKPKMCQIIIAAFIYAKTLLEEGIRLPNTSTKDIDALVAKNMEILCLMGIDTKELTRFI